MEALEHIESGKFKVKLLSEDPLKALDKHGKIPIPPYLRRGEEPIASIRFYPRYFTLIHFTNFRLSYKALYYLLYLFYGISRIGG